MKGMTLNNFASMHEKCNKIIPPGIIATIFLDALTALNYIHNKPVSINSNGLNETFTKGVIHRDVSLGNLFLTTNGTTKLFDFGVSKAIQMNDYLNEGEVVGKYNFLPPELLLGENYSIQGDVYSLHSSIAKLVTQVLPNVENTKNSIVGNKIRHIMDLGERKLAPKNLSDVVTHIDSRLGNIISLGLMNVNSRPLLCYALDQAIDWFYDMYPSGFINNRHRITSYYLLSFADYSKKIRLSKNPDAVKSYNPKNIIDFDPTSTRESFYRQHAARITDLNSPVLLGRKATQHLRENLARLIPGFMQDIQYTEQASIALKEGKNPLFH